MLDSLWQWMNQIPGCLYVPALIAAVFALGIVFGVRMGRRRVDLSRYAASKGDEAFFKGIRYILSNDHDHAIEEFTKSVQVNSDTIETYVALGNLYRSKGDIERAIRIRQSIILRPNIDSTLRTQALYDLGMDYRSGGFVNRALKMFMKVIKENPSNIEALEKAERIYEELKDWESAFGMRQRIAKLTNENHRNILAHQLVEQGKQKLETGDLGRAVSLFNKAISTDRNCVDAYLHLGDVYLEKGEPKKALSEWKRIIHVAPQFCFLAQRRLESIYSKIKNINLIREFLKECLDTSPDSFTYMAMARFLFNEGDSEGAMKEIENALSVDPDFWEARRLKGRVLLSQGREEEALDEYSGLIEHFKVPYLRYQCTHCGFEPPDLQWQCPQCRKWDTVRVRESDSSVPAETGSGSED